jgi:hypothetical protein
MNADAIRILLHEYIDSASDKKVKAFYTIIEEDETDDHSLLDDPSFVAEMDARYERYLADPSTGSTLDEVEERARKAFAEKSKAAKK